MLWEKAVHEKGVTGSEVRQRIASGEPWEHLVPESVAQLVQAWDLGARMRCQFEQPEFN